MTVSFTAARGCPCPRAGLWEQAKPWMAILFGTADAGSVWPEGAQVFNLWLPLAEFVPQRRSIDLRVPMSSYQTI